MTGRAAGGGDTLLSTARLVGPRVVKGHGGVLKGRAPAGDNIVMLKGSFLEGRLGRVGSAAAGMLLAAGLSEAASVPIRARNGMVVSQNGLASQVGAAMLLSGGSAVDAAVATAFALAVVHPAAGNIGGGGFLVLRPVRGEPVTYDFRETAPSAASPTMFLREGRYDPLLHHQGYLAVGVPGTVAGLYLAWQDGGRLSWERLLEPAIALAGEGFMVSDGLARSLHEVLPEMAPHPASVRQFSRDGVPYEMGDLLQQPELAKTLERIAREGPRGFYEGPVAKAIEEEMKAHGGLVTREDLKSYRARRRAPLWGTYRGFDVVTMAPPTSGGVVLLQMLNVLEGYDVAAAGFSSAEHVHRLAETMRRAFADRARYLGDPDFGFGVPVRLVLKEYAASLRRTIGERASVSSPDSFVWPSESEETTHVSVVDADRNAVALTTTLEEGYGSKIVVPGAGFLLNNEMGDFNAGPGLTDDTGLIGTAPNLAGPGRRMLSSMTPTILMKDKKPYLVVGSPGGRSIPNTVLQVILNVVDFGMNVQEAIDAPRVHHQWLPDVLRYERFGLSPDTLALLAARGHQLEEHESQGVAEGILVDPAWGLLEGGCDRRAPDGAAVGQ